jgi:hypothetical protein
VKLSLDGKFVTTAAITLIVSVGVVVLVNGIAGQGAATAAGTIIGTVVVKLFDKLDYKPSFSVELGTPRISPHWIYSCVAAIFLLNGCTVLARIVSGVLARFGYRFESCSWWAILVVATLIWGGYIVAGWTVGRLFPSHALVFTGIAAFFLIAATLADPNLGIDSDRDMRLVRCFIGEPANPNMLEGAKASMPFSAISVVVVRGYVALAVARIASRGTTPRDGET